MSELNSREQELVALGAAIASNCVPKVEFHIPEARSARLSDTQIKEAVRIADQDPMSRQWSETPREILDQRYAGGEITKDEYEQMKHDLESSR